MTDSLVAKEKKKTPPATLSTFRKLEKTLAEDHLQKLLYLDLVYQIVSHHSTKSYSLGSPTSPYFFEGQKAPVKHASLVLRMIKNDKVPKVRLLPKSKEQISLFLETLWAEALCIACSDEKQVSRPLKEKAAAFIQIGHQLQHVPVSSVSSDPTLFEVPAQSSFSAFFDALWDFGREYCTFCLERI